MPLLQNHSTYLLIGCAMCFGSPVQPRNRKVTAQSVAHTPEFVVRSLKIAVSFSEIGDGLPKSPYGTGLLPKAIESVLKSIECLFPNSDSLCVSTAVLGPIGGSFLIVIWPFFLGNALAKDSFVLPSSGLRPSGTLWPPSMAPFILQNAWN